MNNDIRNLSKWLNEEQEAPIDRQALARVLAMAEQPAPVQQEPVATITITQRGSTRTIDNHFEDCVRTWPDGEYKLFTRPQAREPLTDEQIDTLREANSEGRGAGWRFNFKGFARAIEAKLREKNT